jgi:transposase-like protein
MKPSFTNASTLTPEAVTAMTDQEALDRFQKIRWPETDGQPACVRCGTTEVYKLGTRNTYKCKKCRKHFSMTTGTLFESRKMPIRAYLMAVALFLNGDAKGNASRLARTMGIQYRTAYNLADRIREWARGEG